MRKIFILSPAHTAGARAGLIRNPRAPFDLAQRLRSATGVPLGEAFSFLSGLYFRGKLAYATKFARPPEGIPGVLVITSNRGLLSADVPITLADLRTFSEVPIDPSDVRYFGPLQGHAELLVKAAGLRCDFVLLGSISTPKYVEVLLKFFGKRLLFPPSFVGRGDMSRGGLLLRCAREKRELEYAPLAGAVRRGPRPPKLEPEKAQSSRFKSVEH
ncbi:MAG: hypothetical protein L0Z50_29105 [Verrucomicrobiales bacterium]|nr:hypothetical protein [Verrucomicrobiales bacterium]